MTTHEILSVFFSTLPMLSDTRVRMLCAGDVDGQIIDPAIGIEYAVYEVFTRDHVVGRVHKRILKLNPLTAKHTARGGKGDLACEVVYAANKNETCC